MRFINNHKEAINLYGEIDPEIVGMIIHDIAILTHVYGIDSLNNNDLSKPGSIIVLEKGESLSSLEKFFPHISLMSHEFDDNIECLLSKENWNHILIIYSSEYSISIFKKNE